MQATPLHFAGLVKSSGASTENADIGQMSDTWILAGTESIGRIHDAYVVFLRNADLFD